MSSVVLISPPQIFTKTQVVAGVTPPLGPAYLAAVLDQAGYKVKIIDALGGLADTTTKIILGGPMTGMAHYDLDTPVTKDITGIFALTGDQIQTTKHYAECINCGMCVKVCPVNLVPGMLSMYCAKGAIEQAEREGLLYCIECGCCDYVCPSRRPLVHMFRHAKQQLME